MNSSPNDTVTRGRGRSEELVVVAARLFQERGYDATSMQEIADEMGILKGSLYHYVSTKEDLLWLIVETPLRELVREAEAIFADGSVPLTQRIRAAIRAHCESYERHYPHMFVITRENGQTLTPQRRASFEGLQARYYDTWRYAIESGQRSGELDGDLDPTILVQAIFGMLNWMFRWFRPGGRVSATTVADGFASLFEGGVLRPGVAVTPG